MLLRLVEDYDVLVESFRPGVMDRLGVGYETLRERNPRLVYCAISGYGQDGPLTARSGHDTNYLALAGLLGLTGRRGGPPIQSAGQIADLGGGGLMAAVGILAALHERERSGEGQLVDISMTDGSLSWLAMVIARYFCEQEVPRRGRARARGRDRLLLPVRDEGRQVGLAGRARAEVLAELVRRGRPARPDREAVRASRLRGRGRGRRGVQASARETSGPTFAGEHDCCLEPILDLDEALESELVRAREMVVELDQPGIGAVKQVGFADQAVAHAGRHHRRRAGARRRHGRRAARDGIARSRCGTREWCERRAEAHGLLRMRELAEATGVSAGTIKHYLREGLLPEPVKTSRNMA